MWASRSRCWRQQPHRRFFSSTSIRCGQQHSAGVYSGTNSRTARQSRSRARLSRWHTCARNFSRNDNDPAARVTLNAYRACSANSLSHGMYAAQIEGWSRLWPRSQMLVTTTEDMLDHPTAFYQSVAAFMALPSHIHQPKLPAANTRTPRQLIQGYPVCY